MNFQESTTILNDYTKKCGNLLKAPHIYTYINIHTHIYTDIIIIINKYIFDIYI